MSTCNLERLPLLIYPGELSEDELHEVRVHLTLCERCEAVHAELEAVAAQLDLVPEPRLSPAERRRLLAEVAAATGVDDAGVRKALDLVGLADLLSFDCGLEDDLRASLREGVLARVGLAGDDEDLSSLESELGAALDLVATPALSEDSRAVIREGVLARVGLSRVPSQAGQAELDAALDLVPAPALGEDARAVVREGVLARVGLAATQPLEREEAEAAAALDLVRAPNLSEDSRAVLREGVLAKVGLSASPKASARDAAEVGPALDLVPSPSLSADARASLRAEVRASTGRAGEQAGASPQGALLRFPAWAMAAAAGLLLAACAALYMAPWAQSSGEAAKLAFVDAEKLVRTADETADETQDAHLAAARARIQRIVLSKDVDSETRRRANRELLAFDVLGLRGVDRVAGPGIRPVVTRTSPESFLRSKREVLEIYPESMAALYALRRYLDMASQREAPVATPAVASVEEVAVAVEASLEADLEALRHRDAQVFQLEVADLEQRFAQSLVRTVRQALLIQRGLHAARRGDSASARSSYEEVQAVGAETRAAEIARDLLAKLS